MNGMYVQTPYLEEITGHVEKWIGPVKTVIHEIVSDIIHLDVLLVRPTKDRPCFTLVTAGMSALPMSAPADLPQFARSELIMVLPATNSYLMSVGETRSSRSSSEPPDYYPIADLKRYARYPHEAKTWIGPGHTLATSGDPEPLGPDTQMTGYLVHFPIAIESVDAWSLEAKDGNTVMFLQLYAIHTDELKFKFENDGDALVDRLNDAGVLNCYNPGRLSVLKRKKRLGIF